MKAATYRIATDHPVLPLIDWYLFLFNIAGIARQRLRGRLTCGAIKTRLIRMRGRPAEADIAQAAALLAVSAHILQLDQLLSEICWRLDLEVHDAAFPWREACQLHRSVAPESLPWRIREEARFLTGAYTVVPWAATQPAIPGHFAHLSTANPGLIAFTDTPEKGEADVQTPMKPGRYLAKFYPALAAHEVRDIQETMPRATTLYFAVTADEIERVYTSGPHSCMSHPADFFDSPCHPARVYGESDLQLAYIKNTGGKPVARALVWPLKKRFGRAYGHEALLVQQLEREGYKRGSLGGARIRRIDAGEDNDSVVMPYIDDCGSFGLIDHSWLCIGGAYDGASTNGVARLISKTTCDRCEELVDDDSTYAVNGETWCKSCRDSSAFTSEFSGDDFPDDDRVDVLTRGSDGRQTSQAWSTSERDDHATYCDGSNEWYATSQFKFVQLANGETWVDSHFAEHGKPADLAADNDNPRTDGAEERAAA